MFAVKSLHDARAVSGSAWKLEHDQETDASQMQRLAGSRTGTYHNLDEYGGTTVTEDGRVHALVEFSET
eukprot:COSAG02_NODE_874_length_16292_cov_11.828630_1_plen_68_part_10